MSVLIKCSQEFILLLQKHSSTYHKKHHLFLIHQYYLHNHLSHHKFSKHECICHYYIEIPDSCMMVFLNVRKNQEKTKKSHLKPYSLQLQSISKLSKTPQTLEKSVGLLKFIGTQKYYFPVKTLLLFVSVIAVIFTSIYITALGY